MIHFLVFRCSSGTYTIMMIMRVVVMTMMVILVFITIVFILPITIIFAGVILTMITFDDHYMSC
jgi:hypothetical protein